MKFPAEVKGVVTLLVRSQPSISDAMGVRSTGGMASVALTLDVEWKTACPCIFDFTNSVTISLTPVCRPA
jgi:hypothetical protein